MCGENGIIRAERCDKKCFLGLTGQQSWPRALFQKCFQVGASHFWVHSNNKQTNKQTNNLFSTLQSGQHLSWVTHTNTDLDRHAVFLWYGRHWRTRNGCGWRCMIDGHAFWVVPLSNFYRAPVVCEAAPHPLCVEKRDGET